MVDLVVRDDSSAWEMVKLLQSGVDTDIPRSSFDFSNWPSIHVYFPKSDPPGSITAPMLESSLEIQRNIYRLAAFLKYGEANGQKLTDKDRIDFQLRFVIVPGSTDWTAKMGEVAQELFSQMADKMSGKQIATVLVVLGLGAASTYSWTAYLDQQLNIRKSELQAEQSKVAAQQQQQLVDLVGDSLSLARQNMAALREIAKTSPEADFALGTSEKIQQETVRGIAESGDAEVAGIRVPPETSEVLRKSKRRSRSVQTLQKNFRVLKIDRTDEIVVKVVLEDVDTLEQISLPFSDRIVQAEYLELVALAAANRGLINATIRVTQIGDDVRGQELTRVTQAEDDAEEIENGSLRISLTND